VNGKEGDGVTVTYDACDVVLTTALEDQRFAVKLNVSLEISDGDCEGRVT